MSLLPDSASSAVTLHKTRSIISSLYSRAPTPTLCSLRLKDQRTFHADLPGHLSIRAASEHIIRDRGHDHVGSRRGRKH